MQERIRIPDDKMDYYKDMAEMYVGDDVSPDFYGWVFPKYDHVAVGKPLLLYEVTADSYQKRGRLASFHQVNPSADSLDKSMFTLYFCRFS